MTKTDRLPYGSWPSPLSAKRVAGASLRLRETRWDGDTLYWIEGRPSEGGRQAIVRRDKNGVVSDAIPASFNARTRVHEYGGGSFAVADGSVYFSNFSDGQLYRQNPGKDPVPLTQKPQLRFADLVVDSKRAEIIAVCEDHTAQGEAKNSLVAVAIDESGRVRTLVSGADFYASARLSADGGQLAWLSWNHPNMPWDGTTLFVAPLDDSGNLGTATRVAGSQTQAIYQPEWSKDGVLYFVSESAGWWNLHRWRKGQSENLCPQDAEFGLPQWVFGTSTYTLLSERELLCTYAEKGNWKLGLLDLSSKELRPLSVGYNKFEYLCSAGGRAVFIGASATKQAEVVEWSSEGCRPVYKAPSLEMNEADISVGQTIEFPTENEQTAFGFFYAPRNHAVQGLEREKPPLLVISHGGPTGATSAAFDPAIQYWTTRGFGVLDVNYGGSTGYGREYRMRLYDNWGVVDVDDCVNGARFLVSRGLVDEKRCAIRGGSAGGYTTLCALTFRDFFKAGASYYGVSDIEALQQDTHKFESHCDQSLVGREKSRFKERSPINAVDRLSCPTIFFQGLEDKVVPPNQAERMVEALRKKKLPVAYLAFAGEQHGFRKAANISRCLEAEWYFYSRVFGFPLSEKIEPVEIENL